MRTAVIIPSYGAATGLRRLCLLNIRPAPMAHFLAAIPGHRPLGSR